MSRGWSWVRRMRLRHQFQSTECGLAVLRMVLAHFGREVPAHELRRLTGVTRDCLSAADMRRAARALGLDCRARRMDPDDLAALALPVAVHLHFIHFVVLERVTPAAFHVTCPASGRLEIPREQFDRAFTGIV